MGHMYVPGQSCTVDEALDATCDALRKGGVAVFPTDTVYGIGLCVSAYPDGPERLFEIKKRDHAKKIPLLVPSADALGEYGRDVSARAYALARAFWPGGMTLIVKASDKVHAAYQGDNGTVALRVPGPSIALDILSCLGEAMAVTSANTSGLPAPADGMQIEEEIARQVDAVICAGATRCGEASTIVDCTRETPCIVRVGAVPPEEILSVWKNA